MPINIVVFTGDLTYSVKRGIAEINRAIPDVNWMVVLHSPKKSLAKVVKSQWRNLKRNGWGWIPYQFADLVTRVFSRIVTSKFSTSGVNSYLAMGFESKDNIKILKVDDIHGQDTIKEVSRFNPKLGISLAAPILKKELFSIPDLGTINLHKGKVPEYRGMPPAFWELWNSESNIGCTVHWVDEKLDAGNIVVEATIPREKFSTLKGLQLTLDEVGVDIMREAVDSILRGASCSKKQAEGGRTYRKPTLKEMAKLKSRIERRPISFKILLKDGIFLFTLTLWRFGLYRLASPRVVVLLYHRVSDSTRDNLTVGVEQFDRHMRLIKKYCTPVSIEDLISGYPVKKTRKPIVCITFDDGYLDNYTNAAKILIRHDIPASFFVSTGIIGAKERFFPHDIRRKNAYIPVMEWEQLREMHRHGFLIGSHTVNHIDCAAESEHVVWEELVESRKKLQEELGVEKVLFAYPYGGREHMTPERLNLVKNAGYVGCLSAYGGVNVRKVDPYNVLRRGIHWEFSDYAMLYECLGI